MELHVHLDGRAHLAEQIWRQIRAAILDGSMRPGEVLPPSRELAAQLAVSRNTVSAAYDRLMAEGFLLAKTGAGTFVNDLSSPAPETDDVSALGNGAHSAAGPLRPRPYWNTVGLPDLSDNPKFDFRVGLPDWRLFPYATWRGLVSKYLRPSALGVAMPGDPAGYPALRAAIARHIRVSRAVAATAQDIVVTNGIQQAIDLIARALLEPGDTVAVEEPGYLPPRQLFDSLGARVVGVPVDDEGLIVDALPANARIVYVTPSHQMPLGVAMSLRRRMALLSWAQRHDAAVIEDDYDTEFRYGKQALESVQSLDRHGRVLYIGSFSKVMLPTLRIGFVVAAPGLHHALHAAKFVSDWHTNLPFQAALADFIDTGELARHIRRMRHRYRVRHQRIVAALAGPLAPWLAPIPSAAGLHVSTFVRDATPDDMADLLADLYEVGVHLFDFSPFVAALPPPAGLIFGYGAISEDSVDEGLGLLVAALKARG